MLLVSRVQLWWLNCKIKRKREEMVKTGLKRGLTNEKTVYLSQQLDGLLNLQTWKIMEYKKAVDKYNTPIHGPLLKGLDNVLISLGVIVFVSPLV
ncbi:MAG: Spo0E family sporulation regulatory protein-aspartic acid phosphatase [Bacillaceae bacterium]